MFALDGILIGAGDMRYLAKAMVISALVFMIAVGFVIWSDGGINALWVAIIVFMAARGVTMLWRLRGDDWAVAGDQRK